jgi:hypothetical protein
MELKFSQPRLDHDTYCPYIDMEFTDSLALDREMFVALKVHGANIIDVLVAGYKQALTEQLDKELEKYKLD